MADFESYGVTKKEIHDCRYCVCTTPHDNEHYEQIVQENLDQSLMNKNGLIGDMQPICTVMHCNSFKNKHDKHMQVNYEEGVTLSDTIQNEHVDGSMDNVVAEKVHLMHNTGQKLMSLNDQSLQNKQVCINDTSVLSLHGATRYDGQKSDQSGTVTHSDIGECAGITDSTQIQDSAKSSVPHVVYDKFGCAWLNESFTYINEIDEPTYNKPSTPYVTFDFSQSKLDKLEKDRLRHLLRNAKLSFVDITDTLGLNVTFPCRIILKDDAVPRVIRPFRIPFHLQGEMQKSIKKLQENGVIEPITHSFWQSPIFLVVKPKDRSQGHIRYRVVNDYRCFE